VRRAVVSSTTEEPTRRLNSGLRSIRTVRNGVATKIVENAPSPMPMRSANAKSCSVWPPSTYRLTTGTSVMNVVAADRRSVSAIERFAIAANVAFGISGMFSRTRSKTMIVS
jgi:hypothetical protein